MSWIINCSIRQLGFTGVDSVVRVIDVICNAEKKIDVPFLGSIKEPTIYRKNYYYILMIYKISYLPSS